MISIVVEGRGHEETLKDQPSELLVRIEIRQAYIRAPKVDERFLVSRAAFSPVRQV